MIPRVLEPEAMDTPDDAADYDAMDHRAVNARFVADFLEVHGPCRGGCILDVGTGTARIPIALCQADPAARVHAIDLAASMLALADANIRSEGLRGRIILARADAKSLSDTPHLHAFEAVISNSIIHHIADPAPVLAEMARLVEPGGTLFVRDLVRPSTEAGLARLVETYAGDESPGARALFEASLHAALNLHEIRDLVRALGLPDEGVSLTSDRHWTWVWRKPV